MYRPTELEIAIEKGYDPADAEREHWFKNADLVETLWIRGQAVELFSDGVTVGIRDDETETVFRDYDEGMDYWADVEHEAAHPYSER